MSEETMAITLPTSPHGLAPDRYLDRELSWLAFNRRVLEMAEDSGVPLLERVNYLSILPPTWMNSSWFESQVFSVD